MRRGGKSWREDEGVLRENVRDGNEGERVR